jgi:replication factor A1
MKPGTRPLGRVNPRAGFNNYGFYTYENISVNMVLENDIIDDLKSDTKISTISTIAPSVPRHYFKLIDFSHVISKGKGSRILIGF